MGSPAATRWQPNERLRAQRLRRAWSLADVVRELCALADRLGERPLGVNVTMVYNWETGRHRPRPPYPRLLCLLFECSAEELGLWAEPTDREAELATVARHGRIRDVEYRFRMKDGSTRELQGVMGHLVRFDGHWCYATGGGKYAGDEVQIPRDIFSRARTAEE